MRITKYGLLLERLSKADIEQVRQWRNAPHVFENMEYKTPITIEMQEQWFNNLDENTNYYFILHKNKLKAGVVNLKQVDFRKQVAEAGIFIGEKEFLNTQVPIVAAILIMEFAFEQLHLHTLKAKINSANAIAIQFNKSLGYQKQDVQLNEQFHYYMVSRDEFYESTKELRALLAKL